MAEIIQDGTDLLELHTRNPKAILEYDDAHYAEDNNPIWLAVRAFLSAAADHGLPNIESAVVGKEVILKGIITNN